MKFKPLVSADEYEKAKVALDEAVTEFSRQAAGAGQLGSATEVKQASKVNTRELKTTFEEITVWMRVKAFWGSGKSLKLLKARNEVTRTVEKARISGLFDGSSKAHDVGADIVSRLYTRSRDKGCGYEELNAIVGAVKTAAAMADRLC